MCVCVCGVPVVVRGVQGVAALLLTAAVGGIDVPACQLPMVA